jgi:hypothetical protein
MGKQMEQKIPAIKLKGILGILAYFLKKRPKNRICLPGAGAGETSSPAPIKESCVLLIRIHYGVRCASFSDGGLGLET